jgi:hypothetical protein
MRILESFLKIRSLRNFLEAGIFGSFLRIKILESFLEIRSLERFLEMGSFGNFLEVRIFENKQNLWFFE